MFSQPTPPQTPSATARHEEFFTQFQPSVQTHFPKPHDPKSLVRSDAHVPEWGTGLAFFNQPTQDCEIQGPKKKYPMVTGKQFIDAAIQRNFAALAAKKAELVGASA